MSSMVGTSVIKVKTKKIEDKDKNIKERKSTTHKPPLNGTDLFLVVILNQFHPKVVFVYSDDILLSKFIYLEELFN